MALGWPDPAGRELQNLGPRPGSRDALGDHCRPRWPGTGIAPADAVGRLSTVAACRRQGRDGYVGPEAHRPHPPSRCSWLDESCSQRAGSPRPGSSKAREAPLGAAPRAARMLSRVGLVQEPPPAARLAAASAARLSAAALSHMAILASAACGIRPGRASRIDPDRPDQGGGVEAACARAANFGISAPLRPGGAVLVSQIYGSGELPACLPPPLPASRLSILPGRRQQRASVFSREKRQKHRPVRAPARSTRLLIRLCLYRKLSEMNLFSLLLFLHPHPSVADNNLRRAVQSMVNERHILSNNGIIIPSCIRLSGLKYCHRLMETKDI